MKNFAQRREEISSNIRLRDIVLEDAQKALDIQRFNGRESVECGHLTG